MRISLIAAMDKKQGIGKDNKLLWQIPEDLKRFKKLTLGHPMIMGRKTFESIGRPLPNRINIIISHDKGFQVEGAISCCSLEEAIKVAKEKKVILNSFQDLGGVKKEMPKQVRHDREYQEKEIFIIGGGQIYEQTINMAQKLYLTIVEGDFSADTFFPEYQADFKKVVFEENGESGGLKYKFVELER